ncbi:MAG: hypothetical protein PHD43_13700 [Methylococcales bacterium]|nr:hypothetical protein [Methylococcales bacterium]
MTQLNPGWHFSVDQSLWSALSVRIEELMAGQAGLVAVDLPKAVILEAERIVEQLQLHRAPAPATQAKSASKPEPETAYCRINHMKISKSSTSRHEAT